MEENAILVEMMNIHKGEKKAYLNKASLKDCWEE
jgi:hypothetical protein